MKTKLLSLFVALLATAALWASNTITYTATSKLSGYNGSLDVGATTFGSAITSHTFSNDTGTIICNGEIIKIGMNAFRGCSDLTSVTIPNSVTTIGWSAFENCSALVSIVLPNSVIEIDREAFKNCSALTSINIPNSVTKVSSWVFEGCTNLTLPLYNKDIFVYLSPFYMGSYMIPYGIKQIAHTAFYNCCNLTSITIPNSVTTIGSNAFYGCSGLTKTTYLGTISDWCNMSLSECGIYGCFEEWEYKGKFYFSDIEVSGDIVIPEDVEIIKAWAFSGLPNITSITIPNTVTNIENYAFYGVLNVIYNGKATGSPWGAKNVNGYVDGYLVYADDTKTMLVGCSSSAKGEITIPNTVKTIRYGAFQRCVGITSVNIGNSVISIGDYSFMDCASLTSVTIPKSVTTIGNLAFRNCVSLNTITIPYSVQYIGYQAFESCYSLTSVIIPNSVIQIGEEAFSDCYNLTSATIGNSVKVLGSYAFQNCSKLSSVTILSSIIYYIGEGAFKGCTSLPSITIPDGVDEIGEQAFNGCNNLKSVTIPNTVTYIGDGAFMGCSSLIEVTIPNSINKIGEETFYNCSNLISVTFRYDISSIEKSAFENCTSLTSVALSNDITTIGDDAFKGCSSIEEVYVYVPNPYPFETKDPVVIVNPVITKAFTATTPQYILQNVAHISTDNTPTCVFVHVDLSKMETSQYAKLALDFAGTKYELSTKESTIVLTGLNPASTNQATFYSQLVGEPQWREGATIEISTGDLALTTLTPKVVSAGTAIVAAETNISDYETNVGFEWRKENAPAGAASKSGAAIICNGIMEGRLLNLGTDWWKVRPYYEAAGGTKYYGEWEYIDPTDASYFEPTVHTYAMATSPTSNKTQVRGYVMTGTDEVTEQGFEYWFKGAKAPARMLTSVAAATPDSIYRVQASGQVMTAVLEDLAYSTTYTCRAYAVAGGKTYYGEEVQFLTPEDPRPIYTLYVIAGENGSVNTDASGQYREGETVTLTATAAQGFRFIQWSDGNTDNPRQLTITANTELVAIFELGDGLEDIYSLPNDEKGTLNSKFIIHNSLYLFRNGKLFNAAGGRIK